MSRTVSLSAAVLASLLTGACQTNAATRPATLESADESTLARVKAAAAQAVGRAQIRLGQEDLTETSTLTVLPPPLGPNETASPAMPTVFDIVTHGSDCLLVNRATGEQFRIDGVSCVAVEG